MTESHFSGFVPHISRTITTQGDSAAIEMEIENAE